ncbi:uncharacterized protein LOC127865227 [Dreissena polymorpha]|uniref:Asl1-like glycosyl hydrolase catalytic domain-containing protein n=1 Tax=Dreissena polymorpha TaxID=45954 RepID=A0A9D4S1T1_DREPO|nr:uncharacterized protein LOC127865227 [Dreissena polymorpha]KAH3886727.1 hypothetical protein DPMN_010740 [Dreissena polymorpha]
MPSIHRTAMLHYALISSLVLICCQRAWGSEKKGVVINRHDFLCDDFKVLNTSWWYDYQSDVSYYHQHKHCPDIDAHLNKHVSMVWGKHNNLTFPAHTSAILLWNEPNFHSQANITPADAALIWPEVERNSHGRPLVSPAASPCHTTSKCIGDSIDWFDEFFRLCTGCRIDYLATHSYACHGNTTMAYLKKLYDRYHKKIWLTEFACPLVNDPHKQLQYMQELLPQLEAAPFVYRYSWFKARVLVSGHVTTASTLLHSTTSALSAVGQYYMNFEPYGHQIVG